MTKFFRYIKLFTILLIFFCASGFPFEKHENSVRNNSIEDNSLADTTARVKRVYKTYYINSPPVIDGKLNDSCWNEGEWQTDFTQYSPSYKAKASHKTELKILYNDKYVYAAIRAYDNITEITCRLERRDNFSGDIVGLHFDSYFDHRTAYEFDVTSAGQKIDVWVGNDGWDTNWNAVWEAKVAYEDSAWTAEFEIPLTQLRYSPSDNQVWGLNAWRKIDRLHEEDHWNLVANDGTGLVYTFGELHGLNGLKQNRKIELAPYISGNITTNKGTSFLPNKIDYNLQGGLDAKIGITNNFTLDASINPDFGQVEADPSDMNLSAFETFFEEKRPFFVEGKNIFEFSFDDDYLFYSRRIGHAPSYTPAFDSVSMSEFSTIGGAFKLSGKTANGLSIGVIESVTLRETAEIHHNNTAFKQETEPVSNYFIGRFQKEFNLGNTIVGGIFTQTHRFINKDYLNFLSANAMTGGMDFITYWNDREFFLEVKAVGSNINGSTNSITRLQSSSARYYQRPDNSASTFDSTRVALTGYGFSVNAGKWSKGHWRYKNEFTVRSPGLELNDLGYMTISDIIKNNVTLAYYEKENTKILKTYSFSFVNQNAWNTTGKSLYSSFSLDAESEFMNGYSASFKILYKFRTIDERLLRGGPSMKVPDRFEYTLSVSTSSSNDLYFSLSGNYNVGMQKSLNYFNVSSELSYRFLPNLIVSINSGYVENINELQYIGQIKDSLHMKDYLLGKVDTRNLSCTLRIDYAITPELTLQYYNSPFVSVNKYNSFKEISKPNDSNYTNRFISLYPVKNGDAYCFYNDGFSDFSITNPDFNYRQLRSNFVLRWEYKAGSILYFVWSQERTAFEKSGSLNSFRGLGNIFNLPPENIFMLKLNYWFAS